MAPFEKAVPFERGRRARRARTTCTPSSTRRCETRTLSPGGLLGTCTAGCPLGKARASCCRSVPGGRAPRPQRSPPPGGVVTPKTPKKKERKKTIERIRRLPAAVHNAGLVHALGGRADRRNVPPHGPSRLASPPLGRGTGTSVKARASLNVGPPLSPCYAPPARTLRSTRLFSWVYLYTSLFPIYLSSVKRSSVETAGVTARAFLASAGQNVDKI